jgi:hypothetical protein
MGVPSENRCGEGGAKELRKRAKTGPERRILVPPRTRFLERVGCSGALMERFRSRRKREPRRSRGGSQFGSNRGISRGLRGFPATPADSRSSTFG